MLKSQVTVNNPRSIVLKSLLTYPLLSFLRWTFPSLYFDTSVIANRDRRKKIINSTANNVDPDEMAHYEPSHLDLHCWKGICLQG